MANSPVYSRPLPTTNIYGDFIDKHLEIIQAFKEGKTIERQNNALISGYQEWVEIPTVIEYLKICTLFEMEFRVKPEVITGWINIYPPEYNMHKDTLAGVLGNSGGVYATKELAKTIHKNNHTIHRVACIQISYTPGEGLE
jgi:hypothetical protein